VAIETELCLLLNLSFALEYLYDLEQLEPSEVSSHSFLSLSNEHRVLSSQTYCED
jgi:hypothetical protein